MTLRGDRLHPGDASELCYRKGWPCQLVHVVQENTGGRKLKAVS